MDCPQAAGAPPSDVEVMTNMNISMDDSAINRSLQKQKAQKTKTKLDNFIDIHHKYISYQGATWQKHSYLTSWH
jgi:hypothetical protein